MRSTKAGELERLFVSEEESDVWPEGRAISFQRQINHGEEGGGGEKLTIGTVSHVAQSPDSDSNAFFLVVETTVHDKPNGWSGKDNFISSSTGRTTNMWISLRNKTNTCQ